MPTNSQPIFASMNRREVLAAAASSIVAAIVPVEADAPIGAPIAPTPELELVAGRDFVDWWDEAELRSLLRALAGLSDGRIDLVVDT